MSLLIKGLKMPKTCLNGGCPIDGKYCDLWWKAGGGAYGRHRDCPLVELPDHGDLIDRDALPKYTGYALSANDVANAVINAKAVIPAERSEESICDDCDERSDVGCSWCRRMERSGE